MPKNEQLAIRVAERCVNKGCVKGGKLQINQNSANSKRRTDLDSLRSIDFHSIAIARNETRDPFLQGDCSSLMIPGGRGEGGEIRR
jgi:ribosomal protein S4E